MSSSAGCALAGQNLNCTIASLAAGSSVTVTINVKWTGSGSVYDSATVLADQVNSAPSSQQMVAFGSPNPTGSVDAPLPAWAYALLGIGLFAIVTRGLRREQRGRQDVDGGVVS
jgi:hypothetical protein